MLAQDPEKGEPVFGRRSCASKNLERDDDSKKSHPALAHFSEKAARSWRRARCRRSVTRLRNFNADSMSEIRLGRPSRAIDTWRLLLSISPVRKFQESSMRTPILILTAATVLGLTVTVFAAGGTSTPTDPMQKPQVRSGGLGANPHEGGFLRGSHDRLARGDMSGTGGGAGGHKGAMKGGMKGGMHGKQ
jgi:hypothetical protein